MTIKFNKLAVGQAVEVLLPDEDQGNWTPHTIHTINERGEVKYDDFNIPPFFVRPVNHTGSPGHYFTAVAGIHDAFDIIIPESSGGTERVPFRSIPVQGLWRNPVRGFSVPIPILLQVEDTHPDGPIVYGSLKLPGIPKAGETCRCGEPCPNPRCGSDSQRQAYQWMLSVAFTGANVLTDGLREGLSYDEALTRWTVSIADIFQDTTREFREEFARGGIGGREGNGGIAVVGSLADLEALLGRRR